MDSRLLILLRVTGLMAGCLILLGTFVFLASPRELIIDLWVGLAACFLGAIISTFTEELFAEPAERFMNLVAGFGNKSRDAEMDESGVPMVSLRRLGTKHYNSVAVAMAAMQYHAVWERLGDSKSFAMFRNCADSLASTLQSRKFGDLTYSVWEYDYPFSYNLKPPWISGLAQGVGIQILSRCYSHTHDPKYQIAAKQALMAFFVPVQNGGVTYRDSDKEWWFEEFVGDGAEISRVLNGMIYALIGIHEYRRHTNDPEAQILLDKGIASLKRNLPVYDTGWWTYYDAVGSIASRSYHKTHVDLLRQIQDITGDASFETTRLLWSSYNKGFFIREFLKSKPSWHDMVILSFNIGASFILLRLIFAGYSILFHS